MLRDVILAYRGPWALGGSFGPLGGGVGITSPVILEFGGGGDRHLVTPSPPGDRHVPGVPASGGRGT